MEISGGGDGVFEVLATDGDTKLGGKDVDSEIVKWIVSGIKSDVGVDVSGDVMAMQRIKESAEKAKIELSSSSSTDVNLPYITSDATGPKHFAQSLTRAKFEQMISDIVNRTMEPVKRVLEKADLGVSDIDEIILVGGSTRIPCVQAAVEKFFGKQANKSVNPDEVVAMGASVQGAVLSGDKDIAGGKDILLLDVTPLDLGIETMGGVMTTLIEANSTIPTHKEQVFSTAQDNQSAVTVNIAQGPRKRFADNKQLGVFNLDGIAPAPRGIPQILISFDIDANGILNVTAKDKGTGKEQHITIEGSSGLSNEDIERMKAEAEKNADADQKFVENQTKLNNAEQLAYSVKKSLNEDAKDFATDSEKETINKKVDEVIKATTEKQYDKLDSLTEELNKLWEPVVKKLYESKNAQQQAQPQQEAPKSETVNEDAKPDENIQDADFEEVK